MPTLDEYVVYQGQHPVAEIDTAIDDIADVKTYIPSGASASNNLVTESMLDDYVDDAIAAKQDLLTESQLAAVNSGATSEIISSISDKQDALTTEQLAAVNSGITAEDVSAIAGKQDALTTEQLAAVNSGIDSSKVTSISSNTADITAINADFDTMFAGIGKNILPNGIADGQQSAGITATVNSDKSVSLSGTAESNADAAFILGANISLKPGTYVLSGCPSGGSTATYRIDLIVNGTTVYRDTGNTVEFTISSNSTATVQIAVYRGKTAPSAAFYPMICTKADYEESSAYAPYAEVVSLVSVINAAEAGKQDTLTTEQLAAVNSGIDSTKVAQIAANTSGIADLNTTISTMFTNTGKNMMPNTIVDGTVSAGVTATVYADKTVLLTGTASSNAHAAFHIVDNMPIRPGKYIFTGCPANGAVATYRVDVLVNGSLVGRDTGTGVEFTVTADSTITAQIGVYKGAEAPDTAFAPMLCTQYDYAESTAYEPYKKVEKATVILDVGETEAFTSLRTALEWATAHYNDNTIYEVRLHYDEYDVADDLTAEELTTSSSYVGLMVTKNVRLVGANNYRKCEISLGLDASLAESIRRRLSTINVEDNAELENLTIKASKCRYAVHDDFWAEIDITKTIKNCHFHADDTYYHRAYGAGFRSGFNWTFENCIFSMSDTNNFAPFSAHNNLGFSKPSNLTFINCRFSGGQYGAQFGTLSTDTDVVNTLTFIGCKVADDTIPAVRLYEESPSNYGRGCLMSVTGFGNTFGNEDVVIQVTDGVDYSDRVDLI